jgi:hypothetical protein
MGGHLRFSSPQPNPQLKAYFAEMRSCGDVFPLPATGRNTGAPPITHGSERVGYRALDSGTGGLAAAWTTRPARSRRLPQK